MNRRVSDLLLGWHFGFMVGLLAATLIFAGIAFFEQGDFWRGLVRLLIGIVMIRVVVGAKRMKG
mgnify:CR=1 FL=1